MEKRRDNKGRILRVGESQRKDGRYMYRYTDTFGRRCTEYSWKLVETDRCPKGKKNGLSLREKEKAIAKSLEDFIAYQAGKMTLNQLFDQYISLKQKKIKIQTIRNYTGIWDKNVRGRAEANMSISVLRKHNFLKMYQDMLEDGGKKGSIILMYKVTNAILNFAMEEDYIKKNYAKGCMKELGLYSGERAALSVEEQNAFLCYVASHEKYGNLYWTYLFMLETACRVSEMAGLTWEDVHEEEGFISVSHQLLYIPQESGSRKYVISLPKTRKGKREIPLSRNAKRAISVQRELMNRVGMIENYQVGSCQDFCFLTMKNKLWNTCEFDRILGKVVEGYNKQEEEEAGIEGREAILLPHISAHVLRHTGCTRMAEKGMDIRTLQEIMGHENFKVTMKVYNHVDAMRLRREMDRIEGLHQSEILEK